MRKVDVTADLLAKAPGSYYGLVQTAEGAMTLREYLATVRKPEYHGINARLMLKGFGDNAFRATGSIKHTVYHLGINSTVDGGKHELLTIARNMTK